MDTKNAINTPDLEFLWVSYGEIFYRFFIAGVMSSSWSLRLWISGWELMVGVRDKTANFDGNIFWPRSFAFFRSWAQTVSKNSTWVPQTLAWINSFQSLSNLWINRYEQLHHCVSRVRQKKSFTIVRKLVEDLLFIFMFFISNFV